MDEALHAAPGRQLTVYDGRGTLIGSTNRSPELPLDAARVALLREQGTMALEHHRLAAVVVEDGAVVGYGVFTIGPPPVPFSIGSIALVGIALLLGSLVFARSLTRPLRTLEAAANAFGEGQLDVRVRTTGRDEIGAVGRAFDTMADRVTTLVRSHRELMANVAHELRTPMARIRMALDLAHEGDGELARTMLTEIEGDLGDLERLVQDVLISARLDLADAPLQLADIAVDDLLSSVASRARELGVGHNVVLDLTGDAVVRGDEALLRRVLDNLLTNARTYSEPGTTVTLRTVSMEPGRVRIEVADEGIGIEQPDLARLFEPFFRADTSRTRATGGTGLGLALSKKIVDAHGGAITIASTPGIGTTVRVELKAASQPR